MRKMRKMRKLKSRTMKKTRKTGKMENLRKLKISLNFFKILGKTYKRAQKASCNKKA